MLKTALDFFDSYFMRLALNLARQASDKGEVPVGAVVARGGVLLASGYNTREALRDPLGHAEINALRGASSLTGDKRLFGCSIYVTLEPCPMCAGAILEAGISRIVFGAYDEKAGACGTFMNVADYPGYSKRAEIKGGVMEKECRMLLQDFFKKLREKRRDG